MPLHEIAEAVILSAMGLCALALPASIALYRLLTDRGPR